MHEFDPLDQPISDESIDFRTEHEKRAVAFIEAVDKANGNLGFLPGTIRGYDLSLFYSDIAAKLSVEEEEDGDPEDAQILREISHDMEIEATEATTIEVYFLYLPPEKFELAREIVEHLARKFGGKRDLKRPDEIEDLLKNTSPEFIKKIDDYIDKTFPEDGPPLEVPEGARCSVRSYIFK